MRRITQLVLAMVTVAACSSNGNRGDSATQETVPRVPAGGSTSPPSGGGQAAGGAETPGGTSGGAAPRGSVGGSSDPEPGGFDITLSLSPAIGTVGIVEWSTPAEVEAARVDFWRDVDGHELSAPVDPGASSYRTLLLGMKPSATYRVQIVVTSGGSELESEVLTLETESLPAGLPALEPCDHHQTHGQSSSPK